MLTFDCDQIISEPDFLFPYSHEYEEYLNFFKWLAHVREKVTVYNAPHCWVPFILYLGHHVETQKSRASKVGWDGDCNTQWGEQYKTARDTRHFLEIASTTRPELVHALYCVDTEWPCPFRHNGKVSEFVVVCNGSFYRDEVQEYRTLLTNFEPSKTKAVLVPCAADKPYPSKMHKAVLDRINTNQWHLITATGVLGLVPQELWESMPHYDSGLPNLKRCQDTVAWYFSKHKYECVIVYSDFYATAIADGFAQLSHADTIVDYVLGTHFRDRYENLLLLENLQLLERSIAKAEACSI